MACQGEDILPPLPQRGQCDGEDVQMVVKVTADTALGHLRVQQVKPTDLKRYDNEASLAPAILDQRHALLHSALKAAQLQGVVQWNMASLLIGKLHRPEGHEDVLHHCWEAEEARRFIASAKELGPQPAAFYTLTLDSAARQGELCGLKWTDIDIDAGTSAFSCDSSSNLAQSP
jgi:integrase